ncbi:hypothetical protein MTF65_02070 [Streptomyces sp. APSN-46.1]|uniref:hypothetical protein n=1 Tax=Streptomyces sp. APSN-46.1 TaxID=2929049 RepID=UPI001FB25A04|nr:hypothetical protein [Streptomyces sp. APSN-46.1]MCJ1676165.1 hypothetical protein [Streptomyces sp. APSN-46.1]
MELVGDLLHHPPVQSDLGPVLHLDDLAAANTGALFGRAEVRDAIDVNPLLKAGHTRARLLELAAQNEADPASTSTRLPSPASSTTPTGSSPHTASMPRPRPPSARSSRPGTASSPTGWVPGGHEAGEGRTNHPTGSCCSSKRQGRGGEVRRVGEEERRVKRSRKKKARHKQAANHGSKAGQR